MKFYSQFSLGEMIMSSQFWVAKIIPILAQSVKANLFLQ